MAIRALVLRTAGTNCDMETAYALEAAGFEAEKAHVNSLARGEVNLRDYRLLALPGGFSHGDYLGSGKVLANKLLYKLNSDVPDFIKAGNLAIGICNGFQVMVKAGLLPGFGQEYKGQDVTLTFNDSGHFQCEWVKLKNAGRRKCVFTKEMESLYCPIAHGEGKFLPGNDNVLKKLYDNNQVVFKYEKNPNGSVDDIAGICDESGRVLGMMPHPERNISPLNDPRYGREELKHEGEGMAIFRNAFEYLKK